jgi:hypothetical protein
MRPDDDLRLANQKRVLIPHREGMTPSPKTHRVCFRHRVLIPHREGMTLQRDGQDVRTQWVLIPHREGMTMKIFSNCTWLWEQCFNPS